MTAPKQTRSNIATFFTLWLCCWPLAALAIVVMQGMGTQKFLMAVDFRPYYTGGFMLLHGARGSLYDIDTQWEYQRQIWPQLVSSQSLLPFLAPPFVAAPFSVLAALPPLYAYCIWLFINTLLLATILYLLRDEIGSATLRQKWFGVALALTFSPVVVTVLQGQLSLLFALWFLLAWRALKTGQDFQAGLWLALLLMKPQLLLVPALTLLFKSRFRALAGLAIGSALLLGCSSVVIGFEGLRRYSKLLGATSGWGDAYGVHPQQMHTWRGFVHHILRTDNGDAVRLWWFIGIAIVVLLALWGWRGLWNVTSERFALQCALAIVAGIFCSPYLYVHDLALLLVPAVLLLRCVLCGGGNTASKRALLALPFIGYLALWIGFLFPVGLLHIVPASVLFFVLFLMVVSLVLSNRARQDETGDARSAL